MAALGLGELVLASDVDTTRLIYSSSTIGGRG